MTDPNADVLTWLETADTATRDQAVNLCGWAATEIRRLRAELAAQARRPRTLPLPESHASANDAHDSDVRRHIQEKRHASRQ